MVLISNTKAQRHEIQVFTGEERQEEFNLHLYPQGLFCPPSVLTWPPKAPSLWRHQGGLVANGRELPKGLYLGTGFQSLGMGREVPTPAFWRTMTLCKLIKNHSWKRGQGNGPVTKPREKKPAEDQEWSWPLGLLSCVSCSKRECDCLGLPGKRQDAQLNVNFR